jgi:hypothetical protein
MFDKQHLRRADESTTLMLQTQTLNNLYQDHGAYTTLIIGCGGRFVGC